MLYESIVIANQSLAFMQENPCQCVDVKLTNAAILLTFIIDLTAERDAWMPDISPEDKARILHFMFHVLEFEVLSHNAIWCLT